MAKINKNILGIIVPCYNEQDSIIDINEKLMTILMKMKDEKLISKDSFITFIDDGSTDDTWKIICSLNQHKAYTRGIKLKYNVGQQKALREAMNCIKEECDMVVTIDADCQDDPQVIYEMVQKFNEGNKIVYGVRKSRKDSKYRKFVADTYYWFINKIGVKSVKEHPEFRLMSKDVVNYICDNKQEALYIRGICASLTNIPSTCVYYERKEREKGISKYNFNKLVETAFDGISNAGVNPLSYIIYLGVICFLVSLAMFIFDLICCHTSIKFDIILIFISLNILSIGVVGQWVGRILTEVQHRPGAIIEEQKMQWAKKIKK